MKKGPGPKDKEWSGSKEEEEFLAVNGEEKIGLWDEDAELNDGERLYEASDPNEGHDETRGGSGSGPLGEWKGDANE